MATMSTFLRLCGVVVWFSIVHAHTHSKLPKMLDLTWTFDNKTQYFQTYWPDHSFHLYAMHRGPIGNAPWCSFNYMNPIAEHGGTHMDAPSHFSNKQGALSIHQIPPQSLLGPGVVIDISNRASKDPRASVTKNDLLMWEGKHGRIPEGALVFMHSGWQKRFFNDRAFWGSNSPDYATHVHPGFSLDAAKILLKRNIHGIGTDAGNLDVGGDTNFPVHVLLLGANIWGLEMVKNLDQVPASGTTIIAMPMNIRDGTGAPTRVFARWPDSSTGNGCDAIFTGRSHHFGMASIYCLSYLLKL